MKNKLIDSGVVSDAKSQTNSLDMKQIICHVCKKQTEYDFSDKNESPICPNCYYKISHQDDFSTEDDLAVYKEYGWKYEK
jgi:uncharacterized CHY-type Zn-finger protein